jgi:hypothetical protein
MTDDQFKTLRAMQFAQIGLLQSIEANIRLMAQQQKAPSGGIGVDWKQARVIVDGVRSWQSRGAKKP